jgi:hypothetical protein
VHTRPLPPPAAAPCIDGSGQCTVAAEAETVAAVAAEACPALPARAAAAGEEALFQECGPLIWTGSDEVVPEFESASWAAAVCWAVAGGEPDHDGDDMLLCC